MTYKFRDTIDTEDEEVVFFSEAISLNGIYPENVIKGYQTLQVTGREDLSYDLLTTDNSAGVDGESLSSKRLKGREIVVTFYLEAVTAADFAHRYRLLKDFLSGGEQQISFDDEPNLVYIGTLETLDKPESGMLSGVCNYTFYCSNPHPTSNFTQVLNRSNTGGANGTIVNNPDGSVSVNAINSGTLETYPTIKIVASEENGYIGLVQTDGIMEIGNKEEADGIDYTQSETLLNAGNQVGFSVFSKTTLATSPQNTSIPLNGTIAWKSDGLRSATVGSGTFWHGGAQVFTIPADSNDVVGAVNFRSDFNIWAWAGAMGQTGFIQVLYCDANDKLIMGYGIVKSDNKGNTAAVKFWNANGTEFKSIAFETNNGEANQIKKNTAFNQKTGAAYVIKSGANLTYYYNGSKYQKTDSSVASMACAKVYIVIGQYGKNTKFMSNLSLRSLTFQKINVEKWKDVPNRFLTGSELLINMKAGRIYYNGANANEELVTGSEFFSFAPGMNTLGIVPSDWFTGVLDIELDWNERYL